MSDERYIDCDKCGEQFVGESDIAAYIREVDLINGDGEDECLNLCIRCVEEVVRALRPGL